MKKLLLSIVALVATFAMGATEATFDFTNPEALTPPITRSPNASTGVDVAGTTFTNNGVSIKCDKGTSSYVRVWTGSEAKEKPVEIRFYKGGIMTVTAPTGENITSVVMTGAKLGGFSVTDGTYNNGTWTGNANSVVLTGTATTNINTITVTTVPAGTIVVAEPTITPNSGEFYAGINTPVEVSIATVAEGAKTYYKVNDGAFAEYTAPFTISETSTVTAYSELDGKKSAEVSETYTIKALTEVANIKELGALAEGTAVKFTNPVYVSYTYPTNGYTYIYDTTGAYMIYSKNVPAYKQGDVIPAGFIGTTAAYNGAPQLTDKVGTVSTTFTYAEATETVEFAPAYFNLGDITLDNVHFYVYIYNVNVDTTAKTVTDGTTTITLYDQFRLELTADPSKASDIEAIVSNYNGKLQLYPVAIKDYTGVEGVEASKAAVIAGNGTINVIGAENVAIYNASGALVSTKANAEVAAGLYIVKAGNTVSKVVVK